MAWRIVTSCITLIFTLFTTPSISHHSTTHMLTTYLESRDSIKGFAASYTLKDADFLYHNKIHMIYVHYVHTRSFSSLLYINDLHQVINSQSKPTLLTDDTGTITYHPDRDYFRNSLDVFADPNNWFKPKEVTFDFDKQTS